MGFVTSQMTETNKRYRNCETCENLSILIEWCTNLSVFVEEVLAFGLFSFSLYNAPELQSAFKLWSNIQTQEV